MDSIVYYHGDCLDGFGAAYAAWLTFRERAMYRPMYHGAPWNMEEVQGKQLFILDFTFPRTQLEAMACSAKTLTLIDHHTTARELWKNELGPDSGQLNTFTHPTLPLQVNFDLSKSGARLAWEYFHPQQPVPLILQHIEDQDIWKFDLPGTRPICRALRLRPWNLETWHELIQNCLTPDTPAYQALYEEGCVIDHFLQTEIERLAQSKQVMPVVLPVGSLSGPESIQGLGINANSLFVSELGHILTQRSGSFGLVWQLQADGQAKVSLRAENQVNVARIAELYGGGGHPNAAGFLISLEQFTKEILKI